VDEPVLGDLCELQSAEDYDRSNNINSSPANKCNMQTLGKTLPSTECSTLPSDMLEEAPFTVRKVTSANSLACERS
jgi:hypothetical protein